jgi:hypothetical protein
MRILNSAIFSLLIITFPCQSSSLEGVLMVGLAAPRTSVADAATKPDDPIVTKIDGLEILDYGDAQVQKRQQKTAQDLDKPGRFLTNDVEQKELVKEDHESNSKQIALVPSKGNAAQDAKVHRGILAKGGTLALYGVKVATIHTTRFTLGLLANHLYGEWANHVVGTAAAAGALHVTGNPIIARFMYTFGSSTCQAITGALVFYVGSRSLDVAILGAKALFKMVHFTYRGGKFIINGISYSPSLAPSVLGTEAMELIDIAYQDPNKAAVTSK